MLSIILQSFVTSQISHLWCQKLTPMHLRRISRNRNIIANPNCSTIQMLVALKPIQDAAGIDRINVCTYQSVSGAGKEAMEELAKQTAGLLNAREVKPESFSRQIALMITISNRRIPRQRLHQRRNGKCCGKPKKSWAIKVFW